ncbi:GAP family protein [Microbacterium sp. PAMC22086]|uniref:GAP family protein n=1 Tax=Microbacterium sp. PAMC22086 TaxID=2861281 RepID=UPI001C62D84D|nr:GAP family protein [Microbacterium sp. PAMC22086]QYG12289.1 GAP family protein [Microbacterium sp. PAMC22086]
MELFGGLPLPFSHALLALIDGLSVGTLLIPVFLLLHPGRVHARRILLYLGTIAAFYLLVGLLFLWGLVNLVDVASDFLASPAGLIIRLLVGGALLITAFVMPTGDKSAAAASLSASLPASASVLPGTDLPTAHEASGSSITTPPPAPAAVAEPRARAGRITRWRERLLDPRTRGTAVMAVAVAAVLVEVATMLPYIVAMTMLADAGIDTPLRVLSLVGYCALMILPAVVLLVLRLVAAPLVQRPLERFAAWMERTGAENTAWIIGIIGFLIARSAATELGLFQAIGSFLDR